MNSVVAVVKIHLQTKRAELVTIVTGEKIPGLRCPASVVSREKGAAQSSHTTDLRELDSQSILRCFDFLS